MSCGFNKFFTAPKTKNDLDKEERDIGQNSSCINLVMH
jgi:hypothetical protein